LYSLPLPQKIGKVLAQLAGALNVVMPRSELLKVGDLLIVESLGTQEAEEGNLSRWWDPTGA